MTGRAYSEDRLVEQPAIGLLTAFDWTILVAIPLIHSTRDLVLPRLLSGQMNLAGG
jgi:hypothetical protein